MFHFEDSRYNRQENMPEWGIERQGALKDAKVLVIGAGGVKSTLLMSLAAGGIGNIRIVEFDKVELSNLNRQILYRTSNIGNYKGEASRALLQDLNPEISVEHINERITRDNIHKLCMGWDFIVEGGDSPANRNLVNEYCLEKNKPMLHCSAQFSYGYLFSVIPQMKTSCFACIFPNDHTRKESTGPVPVNVLSTSVSGSLGAAEVFKWYLGYKENMIFNRKLYFNSLLLSSTFEEEEHPRNPECPVCSKYYR